MHKRKVHCVPKKSSHRLLDYLVYIASFAGPLMTIPQIIDVWVKKDPTINITTWASWILIASVWLVYGIVHKEKPIIVSNALWITVEALVVIGTLMH